MKFAMSKLAAATVLAVSASSVNAATLDNNTVSVLIGAEFDLGGGATEARTLVVDTNVLTSTFRTAGNALSWVSNTDLTAAINTFINSSIAGSTQFYAIGVDSVFFDKWAFSNKTSSSTATNALVNGNYQSYVTQHSGAFASGTAGMTEDWAEVIDGLSVGYSNNNLGGFFTPGQGTDVAHQFFSSQTGFFAGTVDTAYNYWNLDSRTGELTYSAVPVPAAAWLLGSGLIGLVGVARRRG